MQRVRLALAGAVASASSSLRLSAGAPAIDASRARALADVWRAFWVSRLVVLTAGVAALLAFGRQGRYADFDPIGLTAPFGAFGDLLIGPSARWDSVWFLAIADTGYDYPARTAFFPLYPLLARSVGMVFGDAAVLGGVAVSLLAFIAALYLLHRLATLEIGPDRARLAVTLVALSPVAFFFSAVYSEALFLALSVGAVYAARLGRWGWAGLAGALAASTRSAGVLLLVPLAVLYLYGPRQDRPPGVVDSARHWLRLEWLRRRLPRGAPDAVARLLPRHPIRLDALWLLLVPAGLVAYLVYLAAVTGDASTPFQAQSVWHREVVLPFFGIWDGAVAAWDGARQLLSGARSPVYFERAGGDPFVVAQDNLMLFAFLPPALIAVVGVLRRLPAAYGAYVLVTLALPLSTPVVPQPLMSLPRFLLVLFPLYLWLALWASKTPARARWATAVSSILLVVLTARFATWHWVA